MADEIHTCFCAAAPTPCFCAEYAALNHVCPAGFKSGQETITVISDPTACGRKSPVICRQMTEGGREFWLGLVLIEFRGGWRWSYLWIDESTPTDSESKADESTTGGPVELTIPIAVEQLRLTATGRSDLPPKIVRDRSTALLSGRDGVTSVVRNREKIHPTPLPTAEITELDRSWPKLVTMARNGPTGENPSRAEIEQTAREVDPTATMVPELEPEIRDLFLMLTGALSAADADRGAASLPTVLTEEQIAKLKELGLELTLVGTLPSEN